MSNELPLTDAELNAMEARAAAATPGPWQSFVEGRDFSGGDDVICTGGRDLYVRHSPWRDQPVGPADAADLDFIAAARQDIPRLVREVRRLRRLLNEHAES